MKFFGKHFQTVPDGLCMARAILMQVPHHPHNYTAEMAMQQVALYMLHHPYKYFKCVEQELLRSGESYESYCYNVFNKNVWGDDLIAAFFRRYVEYRNIHRYAHSQETYFTLAQQRNTRCRDSC